MARDNRWDRLKQIFLEALEQPPATRVEWLARAYGDEEVYSEVRALLDAHDSDPFFLEQGPQVDPADLATAVNLDAPLAPGMILGDGRYRIIGEAGRGGMAVVYVAEDLRLPRRVALKSLPPAAWLDPAKLERFRREAWAAAKISHPGVATVYAFEQFDDHPFIVYELVQGRTLRAELAVGPMDPKRARRVAIEVAQGLAAAHEQGVVHRDLKPDNVMVTRDGHAKVLDFGIAQLERDQVPALTQEGSWLGTPAYMSPEQRAGESVDARTDIYAFGVMLAEMLTGRLPGRASSPRPARAASGGSGTGGSPMDVGIPAGPLSVVIRRCLQLDPDARYGSARELLDALEGRPPAEEGDMRAPGDARWWWEFHQVATALVYGATAVAAWESRDDVQAVFTDATLGRRVAATFFVVALAGAIVSAALRLQLWFTSRHLPAQLTHVRGSRRRWIRAGDWTFLAALVSGALLIVEKSPNRSFVLLGIATFVAVSAWLIEPVTTRAAFESGELEQR